MPNRLIKESICSSEDYAAMTLFERDLFWRLIVVCDDYGRFDGRTDIIRGRCYPLELEKITRDELQDALHDMVRIGVLQLYKVNGKECVCLSSWDRHQSTRAKSSKYPGIEEAEEILICENLEPKNNEMQYLQANASKCEHMSSYSYSYSYSDSYSDSYSYSIHDCENASADGVNDVSQVKASASKRKQKPTDTEQSVTDSPAASPITASETKKQAEEPERKVYGEFENVKLSDDEYAKLDACMGDIILAELIEDFSTYREQHPSKVYRNHYATLLSWWRRRGKPVKRSAKARSTEAQPDVGRKITADMSLEEIFG